MWLVPLSSHKSLRFTAKRARARWAAMTAALLMLAAIAAGIGMFSRYRVRSAQTMPEKSIAVLPFEMIAEIQTTLTLLTVSKMD